MKNLDKDFDKKFGDIPIGRDMHGDFRDFKETKLFVEVLDFIHQREKEAYQEGALKQAELDADTIHKREKELLSDSKKFIDMIPKNGRPVQVWREGKAIFVADPDRMFERKELSNENL